jgi:hypothetical protein
VIKVFEDFELSRVGQFQSVLEAAGIRTLLKNQYMNSVMGEIPFVELMPELWILDDRDMDRAQALIQSLLASHAEVLPDWICPECSAEAGGAFSNCWRCNTARPVD